MNDYDMRSNELDVDLCAENHYPNRLDTLVPYARANSSFPTESLLRGVLYLVMFDVPVLRANLHFGGSCT